MNSPTFPVDRTFPVDLPAPAVDAKGHRRNTTAPQSAPQPKIAILLCTYQGQAYLAQQLDSFAAQTHSNWELWISDDGSRDGTAAIVEAYRRQWSNRLLVRAGPATGFSANFLSLTYHADSDAEFFCFSDQDDIWEPDHLTRALEQLRQHQADVPALYCSRTQYITQDGAHMGFSAVFKRTPSFRNALTQNIGGGNTMVFNRATRDLLISIQAPLNVVAHDWWTYLLVAGAGGQVIYDDYPGVRYRQHGGNMMGQNVTIGAKLTRLKALLQGRLQQWNQLNLAALDIAESCLTEENTRIKRLFERARHGNILVRLVNLHRSGVYRQSRAENLALWLAAILRKL